METQPAITPSSGEAGDYRAYTSWELLSYGALDKFRKSAASGKFAEAKCGFNEPRPVKNFMLRKANDARIIFELKTNNPHAE